MTFPFRSFVCGVAALMLAVGLSSCSKDNDPEPVIPPTPEIPDTPDPETPAVKSARTVLVYMVGDVNLWQQQWNNLNALEAGWSDAIDGKLIVYLDPSPRTPQFTAPVLLEVKPDQTDAVVSRVVKSYPDQDAADKTVMRGVLDDVIRMYPAESHGLMIASHGSGFWPDFANNLVPDEDEGGDADDPSISEFRPRSFAPAGGAPQTRTISGGDRHGNSLEIEDLAALLPMKYDFILMHACLMGNVESAYALKDKCGVYVASSAVLPGTSLPFQIITGYLFTQPAADFLGALRASALYYQTLPDEEFGMLTLSAIRTDRLDKLAVATRVLMDKLTVDPEAFYRALDGRVYRYEYSLYEDLGQVMTLLAQGNPDLDLEYKAFVTALNDAVLLHTDVYRQLPPQVLLHPDQFCGLSCYTPIPEAEFTELNDYYKTHYKWADASGFGALIGYLAPEEVNP